MPGNKFARARLRRGFSLVEVILAIGVFALTIVAVIGLLGPIAQQVRDLQDTRVANSLPAPIREELNRVGFEHFVEVSGGSTEPASGAFPSNLSEDEGEPGPCLVLYGTDDGSKVVVQAGADVDPNADTGTLEIPEEERYFLVQVFPATGNLRYQEGDAHIAFRILISWPYKTPGTAPDQFVDFDDRRTFEYRTAIVVGEPF
ncbi:MAG: hypothetical protein ACLFSZ_08135 [Puniceicoccaceae bacterium]